ncbi:amidohydrolase family protein [Clostridium cylindrosporum]|uniref:Guanine deaminase GuaD n=1 Tax=Clostridium cylindrosporum DSM 605 TaxID=1121307 RepID=A0A0J8DCV0_CLOCY|nr:amidohydrolase family protein [Clostridium cylindrosporum]KMT22084.1 guanine deaminase GuaD [Clostridium cylindrosporum DSM 605]
MIVINSILKAYKGNIIFTPEFGKYEIVENGYIVVNDRLVQGVYKTLPEELKDTVVVDYTGKLIVPGFVDLHFHAPQFVNRGLGIDMELLPWLETYTFPEEAKYIDTEYALKAYKKVVHELWKQGTTRAVLFGTIHKEATKILMDLIDKSGLSAYVGKVNMDRNSPEFYIENTEDSINDTEDFLTETINKYDLVKPIITPRFIPTCTGVLMDGLSELASKFNVPVQSHLSENRGEVEWVSKLHPEASSYSEVYNQFRMFGKTPTVMAHCIYLSDEEIKLMARNNVFVAHSPHSNSNLISGIAPIRKLLKAGVPVGLSSDISGGHNASIASVMVQAVQVSKLKWVENPEYSEFEDFLSTPEVFYLATKGGGKFFGNVGSFEKDYEFDALVIDDTELSDLNERSIEERIQRYIYIGDDRQILHRYVAGRKIEEPKFD